jgi:hypothetical protein
MPKGHSLAAPAARLDTMPGGELLRGGPDTKASSMRRSFPTRKRDGE